MREIKFRGWRRQHSVMVYDNEEYNASEYYDGYIGILNYILKDTYYYDFMQYTGLKDKQGKEIREGDLVTHKELRPTEVFYDGNIGAWQPFACVGYPVIDYKVVGNKYENPELIAYLQDPGITIDDLREDEPDLVAQVEEDYEEEDKKS